MAVPSPLEDRSMSAFSFLAQGSKPINITPAAGALPGSMAGIVRGAEAWG